MIFDSTNVVLSCWGYTNLHRKTSPVMRPADSGQLPLLNYRVVENLNYCYVDNLLLVVVYNSIHE